MAIAIVLAGCLDDRRESGNYLPGSDRDTHGCIPSAGYLWCERTRQCERPWELARERHFELSESAFANFCSRRP